MAVIRRARREELDLCLAIRHEVFVLGQGVPPELEADGLDPSCAHFLAWDLDETIGTARLRITRDGHAKAERVCVRPGHQGVGVGSQLMAALEAEAAAQGHAELVLNAQESVVPFYEALGYSLAGERFMEAGIPHRKMRKVLTSP